MSLSRFFPKTLLSRYLILVAILISLILALIYWAYQRHNTEKEYTSQTILQAQHLQETRAKLSTHLWKAEYSLSRYLISPNQLDANNAFKQLELIQHELESSQTLHDTDSDVYLQSIYLDLRDNTRRLQKKFREIILIRNDREQLFPAMVRIVGEMYPANEEFYTAANLLLDEIDIKTHSELALEVQNIRLYWTRMISEFRAFMAFRTGTFGTPEIGMPIHANSVVVHHGQIMQKLAFLETYKDDEDVGLQIEEALTQLNDAAAIWLRGFNVVREIQSSNNWRMDVPLLEGSIRPILGLMQNQLRDLDHFSSQRYNDSINHFDMSATAMSQQFWLLGAILAGLLMAGYFVLRAGVLQPITDIAHAMHAMVIEPGKEITLPKLRSAEITRLFMAFNSMRRQIRQREKDLQWMAHHDRLTGLPNRVLFIQRLATLIHEQNTDKPSNLTVLLIGLDRFKDINDTYGHNIGDEVLIHVAQQLRETRQNAPVIARLGSDEFAVLLDRISADQARLLASAIHTSLNGSIQTQGHSLYISASIGISIFPEHSSSADELISRATLALHQAKQDHSLVAIYSPERDPDNETRLKSIDKLRHAIEAEDLLLEYQPQINLRSNEIVGFEALIRLPGMAQDGINTQQCINIAEQSGLIHPLTDWVFGAVFKHTKEWGPEYSGVSVGVNLSTTSFHNPNIVQSIKASMAAWGVPGYRLKLEVTEGVMMTDPKRAQRILRELHDLDIKISIDDFGTGYSSLQYLSNLPVNEIKIDKSFIQAMHNSKRDHSIVQTILDFARNLDIRTVAEGVEEQQTADQLLEMGCEIVQGFYVSQSMPGDDVTSWVDSGEWQVSGRYQAI